MSNNRLFSTHDKRRRETHLPENPGHRRSMGSEPKRGAIVFVLSVLSVSLLTASVRVKQTTFEEAASAADIIVLGTVIERPQMGTFDHGADVRRSNRIAVEQYLKGEGPSEINVKTLGGHVEVNQPRQPKVQSISYLGTPQLPEEGTKVLLFLVRSGRDAYTIYSATHGVRIVGKRDDGAQWVSVIFKDPRVMPSSSRAAYERAKRAGSRITEFSDFVSIADLDLLVRIALDPEELAAAPRVRSLNPHQKP